MTTQRSLMFMVFNATTAGKPRLTSGLDNLGTPSMRSRLQLLASSLLLFSTMLHANDTALNTTSTVANTQPMLASQVTAPPPNHAAQWYHVKDEMMPQWLNLTATVEAVAQSTVSAQTSGRIVELPFDVNDLVPQGAIIVRFTDTEQVARLAQAQAAHKEAQSRLEEQRSEFARVNDLFGKGLVAKAAIDVASANLKAATARQQQAKAAVDEAQEQLEQTRVRAPYAGIVQQRHVQVGELAQPGTPLLTGLSLEHLRLQSYVPQSLWRAVHASVQPHATVTAEHTTTAGIPAAARLLISPDVSHTDVSNMSTLAVNTTTPTSISLQDARISLSPHADRQSRSHLLRIELPKADYSQLGLTPGSWQRVQIPLGMAAERWIPRSAVLWRGNVSAVWRQTTDSNTASLTLQPVRLGATEGDRVRVLSGLNLGDTIAMDAASTLQRQRQAAAETTATSTQDNRDE
jgi:RND family efflux transporter MFP subunit